MFIKNLEDLIMPNEKYIAEQMTHPAIIDQPDQVADDPPNHTPPILHTSLSELRVALKARFAHHMQDTDAPADTVEVYGDAMTDFLEAWFCKFAKGQREHGGDLRDRDTRIDRRDELLDFLSYDLTDDVRRPVLRVTV